ncbi:lipid-binding protein [uncultured Algibacter sp.]|uniref:lipid-binding protein n=1 Tax=uncultured Algibacter sp. TaxID=298659 RepID=UPI002637F0BB|nr:lipid-binding protein [uncultured Algibacter sp.]
MKKIFNYILVIILMTAFSACNDDEGFEELNLEKSSVIEMSGDWYVQTFIGGNMVVDYEVITTSNTAADDGTEIQMSDHEHIWAFNSAIPVNLTDLTFSGSNLESKVDDYEITVSVTNGVIQKNGTVSSGTNQSVDFISFDIEFSDDPGSIYHIEGYKRTGFLEDEH